MLHSLYHMNLDPACPSSIFKSTSLFLHIYNIPLNTLQDDISAVFISIGYDRNRLEYIWIDNSNLFITITGARKEDEIRILAEFRKRSELCQVEDKVKLNVIDSILLKHEQHMNRVVVSGSQPIMWIVESLEEYNAREDSIAITTNNTAPTAVTVPATTAATGGDEGGDDNSSNIHMQTQPIAEGGEQCDEEPGVVQKRKREVEDDNNNTSG